jgi:hypothetical protein
MIRSRPRQRWRPQAIDDVRRRVQQDTRGHQGRTGDPLYGIRRVLQRGAEHLSPNAYGRLLAGLDVGDPRGEVAAAYIAGQELRHRYAAPDLDRARRRLHTFYQACAAPGVPELERLGRTISAWEDQLLAYFRTGGVSNGPTEAVNLLVKRIKRAGFNRPSPPGQAPTVVALGDGVRRSRCRWRLAMTRACRATSPSQPRASASSRSVRSSAS